MKKREKIKSEKKNKSEKWEMWWGNERKMRGKNGGGNVGIAGKIGTKSEKRGEKQRV